MLNTSFMNSKICSQNIKTFHELSSSTRTDPNKPEIFAVQEDSKAGNISAIDLDALKDLWSQRPIKCYKGKPCSADALFCKNNRIFLVEFKTGKLKHALRKVYDSILMLIENFHISVKQIRENVTYIVVASKFSPNTDCDESISRASQLLNTIPWKDSALLHQNDINGMELANLDGIIVSNVYGLSPEEFDDLVTQENWA